MPVDNFLRLWLGTKLTRLLSKNITTKRQYIIIIVIIHLAQFVYMYVFIIITSVLLGVLLVH